MAKLRNRLMLLVQAEEQKRSRKISLAELARELKLSYTTVDRWLRNEVERFDAPVIIRICERFGIEVGDLLYIEHSGEADGSNDAA